MWPFTDHVPFDPDLKPEVPETTWGCVWYSVGGVIFVFVALWFWEWMW